MSKINSSIYEKLKADCKSTILINKMKYSNNYTVTYDFHYLKGIGVDKELDYEVEYPIMDKDFNYSDTIIFNSKYIDMDSKIHWKKLNSI